MDGPTESQRIALRLWAEAHCTHPDRWASLEDDAYTAKACWSCLLDAHFARDKIIDQDDPT